MKIRTNELTGAALDWAVAKCEGAHPQISYPDKRLFGAIGDTFDYSTDWAQAGPIVEREGINLGTQRNEPGVKPHIDYLWHAQLDQRVYVGYGPTPLVAAMRAYVTSKLGDEVDVPDELIKENQP